MPAPVHVDFIKIIADITAAGVSTYKISLMMQRQFAQVQRWSRGAEPKHFEGQALLMIHAEYVSVPRETLQTESKI